MVLPPIIEPVFEEGTDSVIVEFDDRIASGGLMLDNAATIEVSKLEMVGEKVEVLVSFVVDVESFIVFVLDDVGVVSISIEVDVETSSLMVVFLLFSSPPLLSTKTTLISNKNPSKDFIRPICRIVFIVPKYNEKNTQNDKRSVK